MAYTKLRAINYLIINSVYKDEWSGVGMWHAVEFVMNTKKPITKKILEKRLEEAEDF